MPGKRLMLIFCFWIALTSVSCYGIVQNENKKMEYRGRNVSKRAKNNLRQSQAASSTLTADKTIAIQTLSPNGPLNKLTDQNISKSTLDKLRLIQEHYVSDRQLLLQHLEQQIALKKKQHVKRNTSQPLHNQTKNTSVDFTQQSKQTDTSILNTWTPTNTAQEKSSALQEEQLIRQIDEKLAQMRINDHGQNQYGEKAAQVIQNSNIKKKSPEILNENEKHHTEKPQSLLQLPVEKLKTPHGLLQQNGGSVTKAPITYPPNPQNIKTTQRNIFPEAVEHVQSPQKLINDFSNNKVSPTIQYNNQVETQPHNALHLTNNAALQQPVPQHVFMPFDTMPFYTLFKDGGMVPVGPVNDLGAHKGGTDSIYLEPSPSTAIAITTTTAAPRRRKSTPSASITTEDVTSLSDKKLQRKFLEKEVVKQDLEIQKLELEIRALKRVENSPLPKEIEIEAKKSANAVQHSASTTASPVNLLDFANKHMKFPFDL